jgi:WxL domain surface cell wall-binding
MTHLRPFLLHTNPSPGFPPTAPMVGVSTGTEEEETIHMRQRIIITLGIAVLALVATTAALAAPIVTTGNVTGGGAVSVNLPTTASFSKVLTGDDQTASYAPLLAVVDATGSGNGWNMTIAASTFTDAASHTLAAGQLASVASACHSGSSCTAPTSSGITYPLALSSTPTKFFNAGLNTGLGKIDVTPTVNVAIPGNAYAGTYTSNVTVAIVSGP